MLLLVASCKTKKNTIIQEETEPVIEVPEGYEAMIVKDYHELESCGFLLMNADSIYYEPIQLDPIFYQNNLKVFVKYQISKNQMSICMKGKKIDLLDIKVQGK
ncbi:MAG: hypothetical protein IPO63_08400 [Bacteroidetes bacterium]|nr:hypothetical protein [Bacteroidota bacterium]